MGVVLEQDLGLEGALVQLGGGGAMRLEQDVGKEMVPL